MVIDAHPDRRNGCSRAYHALVRDRDEAYEAIDRRDLLAGASTYDWRATRTKMGREEREGRGEETRRRARERGRLRTRGFEPIRGGDSTSVRVRRLARRRHRPRVNRPKSRFARHVRRRETSVVGQSHDRHRIVRVRRRRRRTRPHERAVVDAPTAHASVRPVSYTHLTLPTMCVV